MHKVVRISEFESLLPATTVENAPVIEASTQLIQDFSLVALADRQQGVKAALPVQGLYR